MAKKDKKKSKKQDTPGADAVGAVRTAVERTFQATADSAQSTRLRAQDLVDEVTHAAARVREMIEQVGVLEDLKGLRKEVEHLARRVAALEKADGAKTAAASRSGTTRAKASGGTTRAAKTSGGTTRAKSGASKSSGGTRKTAASRSGSSASRSGSSSRSTAPRSAGASARKTTRSSAAKKSS